MVKSDEFDEDTHIKKLKAQQEKNYCHDSRNNFATALLSALVTLVSSFQYSVIEYQKQKGGDFHVKFSNVKMSELSELKTTEILKAHLRQWEWALQS